MEKISKDEFKKASINDKALETIDGSHIGYWKNVLLRFKKNKLAVISTIILSTIILLSLIGPSISGFSYDGISESIKNQAPSLEHWFGTDELGRDIFTRVWYGSRTTLIIGLTSALLASSIGVLYGSTAAYLGGKADLAMMRIVEIMLSIPYLIWLILISALIGRRSLAAMILSLTIIGWTSSARIIRGQILKVREEEYIMAAEVMGVSKWQIMIRHLIPNTLEVILISISFDIVNFIFSETFLSYIGLGIERPYISLASLLVAGQENISFYPYQLFFPGMIIVLIILSFIFIGDGFREALDPRLRE